MLKLKSIYTALLLVVGILLSMFFINSPYSSNYTIEDVNKSNIKSCTFSTIETKSIFEKNGYLTQIEYRSVSLIPEIKNLKCIGKVESLTFEKNLVTIETQNSIRFYNLFSVLVPLSIVLSLYFFNINNKFVFVPMIGISIFVMESVFNYQNGLNLLNFFTLISPVILYLILFQYLFKNKTKNILLIGSFCVFIYLLFYDYHIFGLALPIFLIVFFRKLNDKDFNDSSLQIIKFVPIVFYFFRFISGLSADFNIFWRKLSGNIYEYDGRYIDLQLPLRAINCNYLSKYNLLENYNYQKMNFSGEILNCPYETSYPLIDNYLNIPISNIWLTTNLVTFLSLVLIAVYYLKTIVKVETGKIFFFLLAISPPMNFLIERMNIDLIIYIFLYLSFRKYNKYPILVSFILFFIFTIKYYTIIIFLSLLIFHFINKNYEKVRVNIFFIIICFSFIYFDNFYLKNDFLRFSAQEEITSQNLFLLSGEQVSGVSMSFGLLSEIWNLNYIFNFNLILSAFIIFLLFIFVTAYLHLRFPNFTVYTNENTEENISYLSVILILGFYSNFDYRLPILILIFSIVMNTKNVLFRFSYMLFMCTSVSYYLDYKNYSMFENLDILISSLIIIINIISFHIFISLLFIGFIKLIFTKSTVNQNV